MNRTQRTVTIGLWAVVVVAMVAMVASGMLGRQRHERAPGNDKIGFDVPEFALTDQNGRTFSRRDLAGKVWVADFIFTQCAGPCPLMTRAMSGLQKDLAPMGVRLVSFSVDPEHDTPEVLKQYALAFDADLNHWSFLTGEMKTILNVAEGMKLATRPADGSDPILHSEKFVLVDRDGKVFNYYSEAGTHSLSDLVTDANRLAVDGSIASARGSAAK